jgi:hypothetical protein
VKILLDYKDGVEGCRIAQEGNFMFPLTECCNVEFNVLPDDSSVYTCSSCREEEDAYTWSDNGNPMPTSIYLVNATLEDYRERIIEWLSAWTGIPQDELNIEVTW